MEKFTYMKYKYVPRRHKSGARIERNQWGYKSDAKLLTAKIIGKFIAKYSMLEFFLYYMNH